MNLAWDEWLVKRDWLRSLGLTDHTIHLYRLDQYQGFTDLGWDCMVREALRSAVSLKREQRRRIANATTRTGHQ